MRLQFKGLSSQEAEESRIKFGSNALSPHQVEGFWEKLKGNFKDPIIIILSGALLLIFVLSLFGMTEWYEAVAIGAAVILATFVSTFSEYKNESSFQKLQEEASKIKSNVLRDGHMIQLPIDDVVKGDHVLLQAGDKAPADGYIITGEIKVNQASLTGEAEAVGKSEIGDDDPEKKDMADHYSVFRGSVIDDGEAIMVIESVGDNTFYGALSRELAESEDRLSPLQLKLKGLAKLISKFGYIAALLIFFTFMFQKGFIANGFEAESIVAYFTNWSLLLSDLLSAVILSIIIVVAAVPEGLPMMIAIVLSLNMRKLLNEKVLVRKLLGIETAGSLNLLFSDKTGTMTKGRLEARLFITGAGNVYEGFKNIPADSRSLVSFSISENSSSFISSDGEIVGGNVSEQALLTYVQKLDEKENYTTDHQRVILFNSERKYSASQVKSDFIPAGFQSSQLTLIKGAPEVVMNICDHFHHEDGKIEVFKEKEDVIRKLDELANTGMRLIALAVSEQELGQDDTLPDNAVLVGLIGIRDEIRDESGPSIKAMNKAGVQVVMITGDRLETAKAIATEVGLLTDQDDVVLVSSELNALSDEEVKEILPRLKVIARALPSDKSRMVRISKSLGKVVGMTGDGVNDSAALKQSDVGFAMGSGSEVSKEAGDIVILDDNLHSISNAIRYGRTIFKSIRKFIVFQLTVNVAAVTTAFLGPLIGIDFPLTIIQLLWINMIMDTLAAIAFGGEPALDRYMQETPVDRNAHILTKNMGSSILTSGLFITAFSIFFLSYEPFRDLFVRNGIANEGVFLTAFFNLFIFMILFNAFNVRTENFNLFENMRKNPGFFRVMSLIFGLQVVFTYVGGNILRTTYLTPLEWLYILGFSLLIIPVDLLRKTISLSKARH